MKFPSRPGWFWYLPIPVEVRDRITHETRMEQAPPTIVRVDREEVGGFLQLVARGQFKTGRGLDAWDPPPHPQGRWLGPVKAPRGYRTARTGAVTKGRD